MLTMSVSGAPAIAAWETFVCVTRDAVWKPPPACPARPGELLLRRVCVGELPARPEARVGHIVIREVNGGLARVDVHVGVLRLLEVVAGVIEHERLRARSAGVDLRDTGLLRPLAVRGEVQRLRHVDSVREAAAAASTTCARRRRAPAL